MREGCLYDCNHPLWGGSGGCFPAGQADPIEYECSCGDGYISMNSLGRPSCVSKLALAGIYGSVALISGEHDTRIEKCLLDAKKRRARKTITQSSTEDNFDKTAVSLTKRLGRQHVLCVGLVVWSVANPRHRSLFRVTLHAATCVSFVRACPLFINLCYDTVNRQSVNQPLGDLWSLVGDGDRLLQIEEAPKAV